MASSECRLMEEVTTNEAPRPVPAGHACEAEVKTALPPSDNSPRSTGAENGDCEAREDSIPMKEVCGGGEEPECGCGPCRPHCIQRLARPTVFLLCAAFLVVTQSFLVAGYANSILTTVERRYNLRSTELGLIAGSYDITCMIAIITVSYCGDRFNRPRIMGVGAFIMAAGALLFTIPHFAAGPYAISEQVSAANSSQTSAAMCNKRSGPLAAQTHDCSLKNPENWAFAIFLIAQMTIGIGTSPIYTLGPTYLYDNVKIRLYPVYSGIMFSLVAVGPAFGFLAGALFLSMFVDVGHASAPPTLTGPDSDGWVGAWWIGFLLSAGLGVVVGLPLLLFPRRLPDFYVGDGRPGTAAADISGDQAGDGPIAPSFVPNLKDFPRQLWKLLNNITWLGVSLAYVSEQSISTAFATFIAKYFQVAFDISASRANIITGAVIIPGAFLGILTGGFIMKKANLTLTGIVKYLLVFNCFPLVGIIALAFMGCNTADIVGVHTQYGPGNHIPRAVADMKVNLSSACNQQCACSGSLYHPVCGTDDQTYFSPCHAGCTRLNTYTASTGQVFRNYSSCSCVSSAEGGPSAVRAGKCTPACGRLGSFLAVLFIVVFITALGHNPVLLLTLRSVDAGERSFGLGMQNALFRLLAAIPVPIYLGRIIDSTCLAWTSTCEEADGACLVYDLYQLPLLLFGTCAILKALTMLFLLLTYLGARRRHRKGIHAVETLDLAATGLPVTMTTSPGDGNLQGVWPSHRKTSDD